MPPLHAMRVLHAIHDFLPRHRAGSELYCLHLCQELQRRGTQVHVLCAEYDPARAHGQLAWRAVDGVGVTELINNWAFADFAESYASPALEHRLEQVLDMLQPDVLHVHNLLNLSLRLPALAQARGIPVVATLHDYTLVCASGGQRVHVAEQHVCTTIDSARCARCFGGHALHSQLLFGQRALRHPAARKLGPLAAGVRRRFPRLTTSVASAAVNAAPSALLAADIEQRLAAARRAFTSVDLFVAPSPALGAEFVRLGVPESRLAVADYGFPPLREVPRRGRDAGGLLRIGFLGTPIWHKGVHVLVDAARELPVDSFEVVICGELDVAPDYAARLRRAAEGLPVRFLGGVDHAEVATVLAELDVLVVPSLWLENSPLVIHEAFQAGVPVVGSRLGGTVDLLASGGGMLYDATAADLARCLRRLLDEPGLLAALAASVPRVRSLAEDAAWWQEAYARVTAGTRIPDPGRASGAGVA